MSVAYPGKFLTLPWNFCKWVLDRSGRIQMYLNPTVQLHSCYDVVEALLDEAD
jgi:glutathione peroxidase-family protein